MFRDAELYEREDKAMVQPNTKRKVRNRKPRRGTGFEEYGEYQDRGLFEMEKEQRQPHVYGEENWTQYQGGGVCEEAQLGATARSKEQYIMGLEYQWLQTSPCCVYCGANGHCAAYCERRIGAV